MENSTSPQILGNKRRERSPFVYLLIVWAISVGLFSLSLWIGDISASTNDNLALYLLDLICFCSAFLMGFIGVLFHVVGNTLCLHSLLIRRKRHVVITILFLYIPAVWLFSICLTFSFFLISVGWGDVEGWSGAWYGLPISIGTAGAGTLVCLWRIVRHLVMRTTPLSSPQP